MKYKKHYIAGEYGQIHMRLSEPDNPLKPPLMCLHMFPRSSRNLEPFVKAADDSRIVVAPDAPGYGESDSPIEPITVTDYARSIWRVIDELDLLASHGHVDLFGIHAGAKIATEVARQRSEHINKIALCSAAVLHQQEIEQIKQAFKPVPLDKEGQRVKKLWAVLVKNQGPGQTFDMLNTGLADMLRPGEKYEWGHAAVFDFNTEFTDVLSSLKHPIALMNPNDDLYEMTQRSEQYLQNGKLYDFPQWGQGFLEVHPNDAFNTVIRLLEEI